MKRNQPTPLTIFNKIALVGIISSFLLFFSSFLVDGSYHIFLLFFGIYALEASMFLFGFGLFFTILEELTRKGEKKL